MSQSNYMAICGYLCPKCEGRGFTGLGETCDWCTASPSPESSIISDEDWVKKVHEGTCCGDWEESKSQETS